MRSNKKMFKLGLCVMMILTIASCKKMSLVAVQDNIGNTYNQKININDTLDMGTCILGNDTIVDFEIRNVGDEPLTVNDMEITGDPTNDLDLYLLPGFPAVIPPLGVTTFAVSFAPDQLKDYEATIEIYSDDDDHAVFSFKVIARSTDKAIRVYAVDNSFGHVYNQFIKNGDTFDLGEGILTMDTIVDLEIHSAGPGTLNIHNIEITGDPTNDLDIYPFPALPAAISPFGKLDDFGISFAPDELKDYTATVTIESDAETGGNPFQFHITATSVPLAP